MEKKIRFIDYGMAVDHLQMGAGGMIFDILRKAAWSDKFYPVLVGSFHSERAGTKDIAKIDGLHLDEGSSALNDIGLLSPDSTINWIENGKVIKKKRARDCIADHMTSEHVMCKNTNCITHEEAPSRFRLLSRSPLTIACMYCTREFEVHAFKPKNGTL